MSRIEKGLEYNIHCLADIFIYNVEGSYVCNAPVCKTKDIEFMSNIQANINPQLNSNFLIDYYYYSSKKKKEPITSAYIYVTNTHQDTIKVMGLMDTNPSLATEQDIFIVSRHVYDKKLLTAFILKNVRLIYIGSIHFFSTYNNVFPNYTNIISFERNPKTGSFVRKKMK